jgi:hypothetical protein
MGNSKSKKHKETPEPPKPGKTVLCKIPNCGKPEFINEYCDFHQHRYVANSYQNKNGLGSSKYLRGK